MLFDLFGAERLVWGSDWPVLTLAGGYQDWFDLAREAIAAKEASAVPRRDGRQCPAASIARNGGPPYPRLIWSQSCRSTLPVAGHGAFDLKRRMAWLAIAWRLVVVLLALWLARAFIAAEFARNYFRISWRHCFG